MTFWLLLVFVVLVIVNVVTYADPPKCPECGRRGGHKLDCTQRKDWLDG